MASILVQNKVKDYSAWKKVFDSTYDLRKSNGELSYQIYRDASDPNNLTLMFESDSLVHAQKYAQSPELKAAMQKAGVEGQPKFYFLYKV